jgi:hypothetical protein
VNEPERQVSNHAPDGSRLVKSWYDDHDTHRGIGERRR